MNKTDPLPIRALLISVGGAEAPVRHAIQTHKPEIVWYFCSHGSRETADKIHEQLNPRPDRDYIEVERFEELGPCYAAVRTHIADLLKKWRVSPDEVMVDYTAGTKTMSAALILAATETFSRFSYIGGDQREKAGLGTVIDGKERVHYQANPWSDLAIREVERAADLWNHGLFDAASEVLNKASVKVSNDLRFSAMATIAAAIASRRRLDFGSAVTLLGSILTNLPALYDGKDDQGLCEWASQVMKTIVGCKEGKQDVLLKELLDNCIATARQGRFEDAAARLYRCMELHGQILLQAATNEHFKNGRCTDVEAIPDQLKSLPFCQPGLTGEIKLSLEQIYLALATLDHPIGIKVKADLDLGISKSRWRAATQNRNASILAHGTSPVGEMGFNNMKSIVTEFLGFDLTSDAYPIPTFDARWLEC